MTKWVKVRKQVTSNFDADRNEVYVGELSTDGLTVNLRYTGAHDTFNSFNEDRVDELLTLLRSTEP